MKRREMVMGRTLAIIVMIGLITTMVPLPAVAGQAKVDSVDESLLGIAADNIEAVFGYVAASVQALGAEYAALDRSLPPADSFESQKKSWTSKRLIKGKTALYQTWPGDLNSPPEPQADAPTFYSYTGTALSGETVRQFKIFSALAPAFRSAYRTFNLSWVYMTTEADAMMVYPFLPLEHGVNNYPPRKQIYYTCADFKNRAPGWSPPYLDLAGTGMMITVTSPVYRGDKLLGAVSRDITLRQLSTKILKSLAAYPRSIALMVDGTGLAIGVSDSTLAAEFNQVNSAAGQAVLYFRGPAGLKNLADDQARASGSERMDAVVEQVLARSGKTSGVERFTSGGDTVLFSPIKPTGWFLVLVRPN